MTRSTALVTGGSRGIGAATVVTLAERGVDVAFTYRSKQKRADQVVADATAHGGRVLSMASDLTDSRASQAMVARVGAWAGALDLLVLNASGGLEPDLVRTSPDYAMKINRDAQVNLVTMALPLLSSGGTVVLVTSHWAHLYGRIPQLPAYEPVARSKNAGEMALRSLLVSHASAVRLIVVTGDLVDGTVTPKLLERVSRGLADRRRSEIGALPTVEDMAQAIVSAAFDRELESGHTVVVGGDLESLSAQLSV